MLDVQDFLCGTFYCMGEGTKVHDKKLINALHQLYETDPRTYADFAKHPFYGDNECVNEALVTLCACGFLRLVFDGGATFYEVSDWASSEKGKSYYDRLISNQRKAAKTVAMMLVGTALLASVTKAPPAVVKEKKKKAKK